MGPPWQQSWIWTHSPRLRSRPSLVSDSWQSSWGGHNPRIKANPFPCSYEIFKIHSLVHSFNMSRFRQQFSLEELALHLDFIKFTGASVHSHVLVAPHILKSFPGTESSLVLEFKLIKMKWLKKNTVPHGPDTSIEERHSLQELVATVFKNMTTTPWMH